MSDILSKIFGGPSRVKAMRLFIFNPINFFTVADLSKRLGISKETSKRELSYLLKMSFIKKKELVVINNTKSVSARKTNKKTKASGFVFNNKFPFSEQFKSILLEDAPLRGDRLARRFNKVGRLRLVIASGIFLQDKESRLDLMIVGDRLNKTALDKTIRNLESEIGKELRYAVFETQDFNYRVSVYDRLIRDVLDYPHQKLLDKLGVTSDNQSILA